MYLLDTDHLSVLERGGAGAERLRRRLQAVPPQEVAATVVSYEEQTRGWLSYIAKAARWKNRSPPITTCSATSRFFALSL